ncbi:MAG TPA: hypothetical protein VMM93_01325 [Vicinamibacterales bacterium]|nr:hypothetical protein [Vicinamibacterales bacterium]
MFRGGAEVVLVDAQRRVVSADFIRYDEAATAVNPDPSVAVAATTDAAEAPARPRRRDEEVIRRVAERECARPAECIPRDLPEEAKAYAHQVELRVAQSIGGLRTLMRSLRSVPERKTVVVVSGGLFGGDVIGGRGDGGDLLSAVGHEAAHANANLYVLHLDRNFIEMFSPRVRALPWMLRDIELLGLGLDRFAGGELIRVQAGTGDYAFERVLRETSAFYLLGVEPASNDRDGRPHRVTVRVNRRDAVVRSRAWVVIPAS